MDELLGDDRKAGADGGVPTTGRTATDSAQVSAGRGRRVRVAFFALTVLAAVGILVWQRSQGTDVATSPTTSFELDTPPPTTEDPLAPTAGDNGEPHDIPGLEIGELPIEWTSVEPPDDLWWIQASANNGAEYLVAGQSSIYRTTDFFEWDRVDYEIVAKNESPEVQRHIAELPIQDIDARGSVIAMAGIGSFATDPDVDRCDGESESVVAFVVISRDGGSTWTTTVLPPFEGPKGRLKPAWQQLSVATDGELVLVAVPGVDWYLATECLLDEVDIERGNWIETGPDRLIVRNPEGAAVEEILFDDIDLTQAERDAAPGHILSQPNPTLRFDPTGEISPLGISASTVVFAGEAFVATDFSRPADSWRSADGGDTWQVLDGRFVNPESGHGVLVSVAGASTELSLDGGSSWSGFGLSSQLWTEHAVAVDDTIVLAAVDTTGTLLDLDVEWSVLHNDHGVLFRLSENDVNVVITDPGGQVVLDESINVFGPGANDPGFFEDDGETTRFFDQDGSEVLAVPSALIAEAANQAMADANQNDLLQDRPPSAYLVVGGVGGGWLAQPIEEITEYDPDSALPRLAAIGDRIMLAIETNTGLKLLVGELEG